MRVRVRVRVRVRACARARACVRERAAAHAWQRAWQRARNIKYENPPTQKANTRERAIRRERSLDTNEMKELIYCYMFLLYAYGPPDR